MNEVPRRRLLIVDGHAYAYRGFHAIRSLSSPSGRPTNAIFGFVKAVTKMRADLDPALALVAWDGGLSTERMALLPEYKAQRPPMPTALEEQLDQIVEWLGASGIASHCRDGVEADDWIATVAKRAVGEGVEVVIASSDKDFMQLVCPRVGLLNPNDKNGRIWTDADVREKSGVEPAQVVDWLSLVGDAVDNIPGVPGIGVKTAASLLGRFGSIEGILERLAEVESERLRSSIEASRSILERNRGMIRLKDGLPGEAGMGGLEIRAPDVGRLKELYTRWGFGSLLRALGGEESEQGELF